MSVARAAGVLAGAALDAAFADPRRGHPVAGFGQAGLALERRLYAPDRARGLLFAALCALPPTAAVALLRRRPVAVTAAVTWTALGGTSLRRICAEMADLVDAGDLSAARHLARSLVARRTDDLAGPELTRAALESLAENTADAVGGPLVWAALAGPAGTTLHRAVNTLDAMVGYRDDRYLAFGWASARADDVLGWPAARATAAATVVAAALTGLDARGAVRAWRRDAPTHPSPNAGQVEAAFAGALGVRLGGRNTYGDVVEDRPPLGDGGPPTTADLRAAVALSRTTERVLLGATLAVLLTNGVRANFRTGVRANVRTAGEAKCRTSDARTAGSRGSEPGRRLRTTRRVDADRGEVRSRRRCGVRKLALTPVRTLALTPGGRWSRC